jgi:Abortive infection alpha
MTHDPGFTPDDEGADHRPADARPLEEQLLENGPALARLAAGMWWRAARWSMGASVRTGARLARAAADPVLAAQVVNEIGHELRTYARDLLGITELDQQVRRLMPASDGASANGSRNGGGPDDTGLRVRGALLLRAAASVDADDGAHPAYARILTELAPDEARILRLLAGDGPQPTVDVRATSLLGSSPGVVGARLNMIGAQAGCRHRDRVPAYLNNLERLGLIRFSHEPIEDSIAYQVLEAQPEVMAAIQRAPRARTLQRSVVLTPFGEDFCDVCLPLDTAEMEALSDSAAPSGS